MARFFSLLLWTVVFLVILLAVDQLLLRVPASQPTHATIATFYRDLRSRLLDLTDGKRTAPTPSPPARPPVSGKGREGPPTPPASIESVIAQRQGQSTARPPVEAPATRPESPDPVARYLFVDDQGHLHFAATLAEIPEEYRGKARLLGGETAPTSRRN